MLGLTLALALAIHEPGDVAPPSAILQYAIEQKGRKVGNGQCSALVAAALRHAGLSPHSYGDRLESLREIRPGDILQFKDAEFRGRSGQGRALRTYWMQFPDHVAIVADARLVRGVPMVKILHQNVGTQKDSEREHQLVREWTLNLNEWTRGTITAYRPNLDPLPPATPTQSSEPAAGEQTEPPPVGSSAPDQPDADDA